MVKISRCQKAVFMKNYGDKNPCTKKGPISTSKSPFFSQKLHFFGEKIQIRGELEVLG